MTSIGFSQTKTYEHRESLQKMFEDMQKLLAKCGIHNTTIQKARETSFSKKKFELKDKSDATNRSFQLTLHLPIEQLIPFSEKIGFRYCCHKSQRLEAGVSYRRLREEVCRQHNWLVNRVDEITHFKEIKAKNPDKIVHTKSAIVQAVEELKIRAEQQERTVKDLANELQTYRETNNMISLDQRKDIVTEKLKALNLYVTQTGTKLKDAEAAAERLQKYLDNQNEVRE
jgi:hypothetical protein